jgi:SAM-dependent methyltransferase
MYEVDTEKQLYPAILAVPRQHFVADASREPLITGHSLPTQAAMQRLLGLIPPPPPDATVLHVGTGSGYIAAVLAQMTSQVYALERDAAVAALASSRLAALHLNNVQVIHGDAEQDFGPLPPCQLILCTCQLHSFRYLEPLPLKYQQQQLQLVTDNPDVQIDELLGMNGSGGVACILVTPNDFKRLWSHLDMSKRGNDAMSQQWVQSDNPDTADTLNQPADTINPYLVALYEASAKSFRKAYRPVFAAMKARAAHIAMTAVLKAAPQ